LNCPRCGGNGVCVECSGAGSVECATCDGTGKRSTSRGVEYDCKTCEGTGSVDCSKKCSSCDGTGEITEKLQTETREKYRTKFANLTPSNAVVFPLIALNLVAFGALEMYPELYPSLALSRAALAGGKLWTILTAVFINYGVLQIIFTTALLWYYGQILEGVLGRAKFLFLYLGTGVVANLASYLTQMNSELPFYAGGASGPIYGMIGIFLALHFRWSMIPKNDAKNLAIWGVVFIILGVVRAGSSIDAGFAMARIGGALAGFVLIYLLPRPQGR